MRKLKIYLDTSVISHLKQNDVPDKMNDTLKLWELLETGDYDVYISEITFAELSECSAEKQDILSAYVDKIKYTELIGDDDAVFLAEEYIKNGILTQKSYDDCLHLAIASKVPCDIILSWNFKHMVKYKTIEGIRRVNAYHGYFSLLDIIQPSLLLERSVFDE